MSFLSPSRWYAMCTSNRPVLRLAQSLGLLRTDFQRNSIDNGILLCPLCHVSYLNTNILAFSPSLPVLRYIKDYLDHTPVAGQLPLHELFRVLRDDEDHGNLPDPSAMLDYRDLFVVVPLLSEPLRRRRISTQAQPQPYVFDSRDNVFRNGAGDPTNPNLVHIFSPHEIAARDDDPTEGPSLVLLSPDPRLYWQLPVDPEVILAMIIVQPFDTADICEELDLIDDIYTSLRLRASHIRRSRANGGGVGGAAASGAGGVPRRGRSSARRGHGNARRGRSGAGGRAHPGRGGADDLNSTPKEPQRKKARRKPSLKFLSGTEVEEDSDRSLSQQKPYGVHPETWDVASTFTPLVDEKLDRPSSYFGSSVSSLPEADRDDDPSTWKFGPSFSSDMIIAVAKRMAQI